MEESQRDDRRTQVMQHIDIQNAGTKQRELEEMLLHQGRQMHEHLETVTHSTMDMQRVFTASLDEVRYKQVDVQRQLNAHETALQDVQEICTCRKRST